MDQKWTKVDQKWIKNGPKMDQKWNKNGTKKGTKWIKLDFCVKIGLNMNQKWMR